MLTRSFPNMDNESIAIKSSRVKQFFAFESYGFVFSSSVVARLFLLFRTIIFNEKKIMRYGLVQFSFIGKQCFNNRIRLLFEGLPVCVSFKKWNGIELECLSNLLHLRLNISVCTKNTHIYRKKRE